MSKLSKYFRKHSNKKLIIILTKKAVFTINKKDIVSVEIETKRVTDINNKSFYESIIMVYNKPDDTNPWTIRLNQSFVRYMPYSPNDMDVKTYNKYLKKFILSPWYDYTIENIPIV